MIHAVNTGILNHLHAARSGGLDSGSLTRETEYVEIDRVVHFAFEIIIEKS